MPTIDFDAERAYGERRRHQRSHGNWNCSGRRDDRLEALLVTAPPPTDAEHATGREGIQRAEFDPIDSMTD